MAASATVVIVGADRAPHGVSEIGKRLGREVEWIDGSTRTVEKVERRIRNGSVGGVIVLEGFMPHRHFVNILAAARAAYVPFAYGGRGGKAALVGAADTLATALKATGT